MNKFGFHLILISVLVIFLNACSSKEKIIPAVKKINSLCERSHIIELSFAGFENIDATKNYCEQANQLTEKMVLLLDEIMLMNARFAKILGVTEGEVFHKNFSLRIQGSDLGVLASETENLNMKIGVFPSWFTDNHFERKNIVDHKAYFHELAHIVQNVGGNEFLRAASKSQIIREVFPDYIESALYNKYQDGKGDLIGCLDSRFELKKEIHFNIKEIEFNPLRSMKKLTNCCYELESKKQQTASTRKMCKSMIELAAKREINPYQTTEIDFLKFGQQQVQIDQISLILNSFLKENQRGGDYLLNSVSKLGNTPAFVYVDCELQYYPQYRERVLVSSITPFLKKLRFMNPFKWKRFNLDPIIELSEQESESYAAYEAARRFIVQANESESLNSVLQCMEGFSQNNFHVKNCNIICHIHKYPHE